MPFTVPAVTACHPTGHQRFQARAIFRFAQPFPRTWNRRVDGDHTRLQSGFADSASAGHWSGAGPGL